MRPLHTFLLAIFVLFASSALAVQPDEVLDDPILEGRARDISAGLRCPVCQNESIDESNADIARDLRLLVRDRLRAGDSDEQVVAYIVARYGEFVLLRPNFDGANRILWILPMVMILAGLGLSVAYIRGRRPAPSVAEPGLSDVEKKRLDEILGDEHGS